MPAERDIWLPILKPSLDRWFDLELVIEASQFSFVWQETLEEFQQLLEGQGAFRNVRTWTVTEGAMGQPQLVAKRQQVPGIGHRPAFTKSIKNWWMRLGGGWCCL